MKNLAKIALLSCALLTIPVKPTYDFDRSFSDKRIFIPTKYPWEDYVNFKPEKFPEEYSTQQIKVLRAMKKLEAEPVPKSAKNCWDIAQSVYEEAGVTSLCKYTEKIGRIYRTAKGTIVLGRQKYFVPEKKYCPCLERSEQDKLDLIKPGDLLACGIDWYIGHNVIFQQWENREKNIAKVFDGQSGTKEHPRYQSKTLNLSDNKHPVFIIWQPY